MKAAVKTLDAESAGEVELDDAIFGLEPRTDLIHRMVRYQTLKRMAGTHHAQDRSEVTVTGKKMYKQKGTGGARHGDKSVPQWRGGGKVFGPKPRRPMLLAPVPPELLTCGLVLPPVTAGRSCTRSPRVSLPLAWIAARSMVTTGLAVSRSTRRMCEPVTTTVCKVDAFCAGAAGLVLLCGCVD